MRETEQVLESMERGHSAGDPGEAAERCHRLCGHFLDENDGADIASTRNCMVKDVKEGNG